MKVIEVRKDSRTGEIVEVSWGDNITSDFSIISSVAKIIDMKRQQEVGKADSGHHPILDRFTTVAIHIEF